MEIKNIRNIIKVRNLIINTVQIMLGTAILSAAIAFFLLPNHISTGGFSGIATIGYYLLNIPMGISIFILNIPLFIIVLIKKGSHALISALIGTIMLSIFVSIFENLKPLTHDRLLASIYGGILAGIGTAIVFRANASTGGTDLLANIIQIFKPDLKRGELMVAFDAVIIFLNVIFFKEIEVGLYSAVVIYIMGKILDAFFEGINFSRMILIISPENEKIAKEIGNVIKRGTTSLYGKGMYKEENKEVLLCVTSRGEVRDIRRIIKQIDANAFIVITNAREVFGKGFKEG